MAYEIGEAKELVIRAGRELLRTGLIARTWGNISARISDTQFVITPSGRGYESLTQEEIVPVNIADGSYEGEIRPSSEKGVHAAAYRNRPDACFVIHTHQDFATDLSTLGKTFDVASIDRDAVRVLGPVLPTAGYGLSATKQITDNVEKAIREHPDSRAILMQNHGTLCIGQNREDAFHIAHVLEDVCRKEYRAILNGTEPAAAGTDPFSAAGGGKSQEEALFPQEADRGDYALSGYSRIWHRENPEEFRYWEQLFAEHRDIHCVITTDAPFIRRYSMAGNPLTPYVDDLAMIVGMTIPVIPAAERPGAGAGKAGDRLDSVSGTNGGEKTESPLSGPVSRALTGTDSAVLVPGRGAVCTAGNEGDAEAVVMILDKGCQMGLLEQAGAKPIPVTEENGNYEHRFYVEQYSKRK